MTNARLLADTEKWRRVRDLLGRWVLRYDKQAEYYLALVDVMRPENLSESNRVLLNELEADYETKM